MSALAQTIAIAFYRSQNAVLCDIGCDPVGDGFEVRVGVAHGDAQAALLEEFHVVGDRRRCR